jgi:hypothetical protein
MAMRLRWREGNGGNGIMIFIGDGTSKWQPWMVIAFVVLMVEMIMVIAR